MPNPLLDQTITSHIHKPLTTSNTLLNNDFDHNDRFFVADLGTVTRQHRRWKQNLPSVRPFYGTLPSLSSHPPLTRLEVDCKQP